MPSFCRSPAPLGGHKSTRCYSAAFDALLGVADEALVVDRSTVVRGKEIVMGHTQVSARDAVHLAVMERHEIERTLSCDSGFDGFPGVSRLS
jgi:uncharacterized protein